MRGIRRFLYVTAVMTALAVPATASAYTVTVNVHGAGKVEEVPNRFGEEKHQLDCSVSPGGKTESTETQCVAGTESGLYNSGNIVNLLASVPQGSAAYARGWRFSRWVDSNAGGMVNCDPQGTVGSHLDDHCEFQVFQNLTIDLYFDDTFGPTDTTVTGGPSQVTNSTNATFNFNAASDPDAVFECRLDRPSGPGTFGPCGGPADKSESYSGLTTNGAYTFHVRSFDPSGNQGADTAVDSRGFTIDTASPETTITSGPSGPTANPDPTFEFGSPEANVTLTCTLDDDAPFGCNSGSYDGPALADGEHTFTVFATDQAGNADGTPAVGTFTVDTVDPQAEITQAPKRTVRLKRGKRKATVEFEFESSDVGTGVESSQCKLNDQPAEDCSDSTRYKVGKGRHVFTYTATDAAGNETSDEATFKVVKARR